MSPQRLRSILRRALRCAAVGVVLVASAKRSRAQHETRPGSRPVDPDAARDAASRPSAIPERVTLRAEPPPGFDLAVAAAARRLPSPFAFGASKRASVAASLDEAARLRAADELDRAASRLSDALLLRALLAEDAGRLRAGLAPARAPARVVAAALRQIGEAGLFDPWLVAWGRARADAPAATADERAELADVLHAHARAAAVLTRVAFAAKDAEDPRWMSKAGPRPRFVAWPPAPPAEPTAASLDARRRYAAEDAGPWERDGDVVLRVAEGVATLRRRGGVAELAAGDVFEFRRLDVLVAGPTGVRLDAARYGAIRLPPSGAADTDDLAAGLDAAGSARVAADVAAAADGSAEALARLEDALPLALRAIREEVARRPASPGAPALRLLLALDGG